MSTIHQWKQAATDLDTFGDRLRIDQHLPLAGPERRAYRRYDLEQQQIEIERFDGHRGAHQTFGRVVDLSAGGVRIRTLDSTIQTDQQIRVRLELPASAGICAFVNTAAPTPRPTRQWVGWVAVARVQSLGDGYHEIAGRLMDMDELDRGMLGLYLSTQPLAA